MFYTCDERFYIYMNEKADYVFINESGYYDLITA